MDLYSDADQIRSNQIQLFKDAASRTDVESALGHYTIQDMASFTVFQVITTIREVPSRSVKSMEELVNGFRQADARRIGDLQQVAASYEQASGEIKSRFGVVSANTPALKKADRLMQSANDRFDRGDLLGAYIAENHANLLLYNVMIEIEPFRVSIYNKSHATSNDNH